MPQGRMGGMTEIEKTLEKLGSRAFNTTIGGHEVQSHLLNVREEFEVNRLTKEFEGTLAYPSALKAATFALSADAIDGTPFFTALQNDAPQTALARFKKAQTFYRGVIEAWWKAYDKNAMEEAEVIGELKKKSGKPSKKAEAKS